MSHRACIAALTPRYSSSQCMRGLPEMDDNTVAEAELSSVITSTLGQVLELRRAQKLKLRTEQLEKSIQQQLFTLAGGIRALRARGAASPIAQNLEDQYMRISDMLEQLVPDSMVVPSLYAEEEPRTNEAPAPAPAQERNVWDDAPPAGDDAWAASEGDPLTAQSPAQAADFGWDEDEARRHISQDDAELARAQVMLQQQRRIMDQDDATLDALSQAISRQHALSLSISNELEQHHGLLDETEDAMDRAERGVSGAADGLGRYQRRARRTSTIAWVGAIAVLVFVLVVVFKL